MEAVHAKYLFSLTFFILGLVGAGIFYITQIADTQPTVVSKIPSKIISQISPFQSRTIVAGIVPHHKIGEEQIITVLDAVMAEDPETIVVLSPDHWGRSRTNFVTVETDSYDGYEVDQELSKKILERHEGDFSEDDRLLLDEHGVRNVVSYIDPESDVRILPIVISSRATEDVLERLAQTLTGVLPENAIVISSTDFSHYLPVRAGDLHDATSREALTQFDKEAFSRLEVDCWQCLYLVSSYAEAVGGQEITQLKQGNSAVIEGVEGVAEETTSYISLLYTLGDAPLAERSKTMIAVGDLMLGRYVEVLMERNGSDYPFTGMHQFFRGVDLVLGNFEGTIPETHVKTPDDSVRFSFKEEVARELRKSEFELLTLGNNHAYDFGESGFVETRKTLTANGLVPIGHPFESVEEYVHFEPWGDGQMAFVSLNGTPPGWDAEAATDLIRSVEEKSDFTIVSIHWGWEYFLESNDRQQEWAHGFIDAGADVIIGHHPHVVQEVEVYKGRAIFYSLGNYIFDQYFSEHTQEGLAIGIELYENEVVYRLFPVDIPWSQPKLKSRTDDAEWLQQYAERAAPELRDQIANGILRLIN